MKQSRPIKKKKNRTWAEAITEALARSSRPLGVQEIHEKIILYKLKDIQMIKQDGKVLKTMLAQSMNSETCAFYKVKDKSGCYALKEPSLYMRAVDKTASDVDSPIDVNEDSNGSGNSAKKKSKRKGSPNVVIAEPRNLEKKKSLSNKIMSNSVAKRSNSYTGNALRKAQLLSRRRTSTPNVMPSLSYSNLRTRPHLQPVHRSRSTNSLQKSHSNPSFITRRSQAILDLETPSSILTNTRLKSIINSATFSMLPTSYQYQLIQLLPEVDRTLDENGVPRMTSTALNNEFFSQALQDWSTQLSEGEFTRETQARIMQEIAKERSKIAPWKEKFFEEYYGQKQEVKRTRSRSHDATANLADLSFEAQLVKFRHLTAAVDDTMVREEEDEQKDVLIVESGSETDQDPDYIDNIPLASRFASKDSLKPKKDRRKISKPFKRSVINSSGKFSQNTSMIHRRGVMQPSTNPLFAHFASTAMSKFKAPSMMHSHPNFQVREEVYRSDSEASDTGELSDSNSFHQHDETDEEDDGESSDGMMNLGDNNLMDVDDDSDSDDGDRTNTECVTTDHSYTKMMESKARRRSSDDHVWRNSGLAKVRPVLLGDRVKSEVSMQSRTLVLGPEGNLAETVGALDESGDSTDTSPEQVCTELLHDQPSFEKVVPAAKQEITKQEKLGVLFSRELQPSVNSSYGESIIPRISTTSGLLSSPITPTTVCTSTTQARISQHGKNNDNILPTKCRTSPENTVTLEPKEGVSVIGGMASVPQNAASLAAVPRTMRSSQTTKTTVTPATATRTQTGAKASNQDQESTTPSIMLTNTGTSSNQQNVILKTFLGASSQQNYNSIIDSNTVQCDTSPLLVRASPPSTNENSKILPVLSSPRPGTPGTKRSQHTTTASPPSTNENSKILPVLSSPRPETPGTKRSQPTTSSSPVKKTRTLAEIKAQMKAKKAAAATASPASGVKPGTTSQPIATKAPVKIAQPVFDPNPIRNLPAKPTETALGTTRIPHQKAEMEKCPPVLGEMLPESFSKPAISKTEESDSFNDTKVETTSDRDITETAEDSEKVPGKIILKIKSEEGKKYSVKVDTKKRTLDRSSDSDDGDIIRKTRRLSQVMSSSAESSDDFDETKVDSSGRKLKENYSMLNQLALPASYATKTSIIEHHSLLKRTQKSPVFGEPAFEGLGVITKNVTALPTTSAGNNSTDETKSRPFMSDKPVIGFQDIPSCTTLASSSNTPTFIQPLPTITTATEAQKYGSIGKGKSIVQMQQLARTNQIPSDESEQADTDTEDDSNASSTSSADDDTTISNPEALSVTNAQQSRRRNPKKSGKNLETGSSSATAFSANGQSDCEDSYSSSSGDDKPVISECICSCKRLVLCKGCGAYTHEECLSSKKLCSLCV